MPANLENSAVATGLEKGSFHPNLGVTSASQTDRALYKTEVEKLKD